MSINKVTSFSVDVEGLEFLKVEASKEGVSMSRLVRRLIWDYLKGRGYVQQELPVEEIVTVRTGLEYLKKDIDEFLTRFSDLLNSC